MRPDPKLAFVVRNEFMFLQIEKLWRSYEAAHVMLVGAMTDWDEFLSRQEPSLRRHFKKMTFRELVEIDGDYDGIFIQTPFPLIEEFYKTRFISVQYGLAKERHNYGVWRALADLNLMYGPYSSRVVSHFSPSVAVGNLKFADVDLTPDAEAKKGLAQKLGLNVEKPTLLYMPTYRELGSFKRLVEPLADLQKIYNVVIKMHHNQEAGGNLEWRNDAKAVGFTHLFGAGADQVELLAVADVVVSDFSGAIFDALYAKKPIVLFQERAEQLVGVQKFDLDTIEYRRRHELGVVCEEPKKLAQALAEAENHVISKGAELVKLRQELMIDGSEVDIIGAARRAVEDLLEGRLAGLSQTQRYVREMYKAATAAERKVTSLENKLSRRAENQPEKAAWRRFFKSPRSRLLQLIKQQLSTVK